MRIVKLKCFNTIKRGDIILIDYGYIELEVIFSEFEKIDDKKERIRYLKNGQRYFIIFKSSLANKNDDKIILNSIKISIL